MADRILIALLAFVFLMSIAGIVIGIFFGGAREQFEIGREIARERHRKRTNQSS